MARWEEEEASWRSSEHVEPLQWTAVRRCGCSGQAVSEAESMDQAQGREKQRGAAGGNCSRVERGDVGCSAWLGVE